MTLNHRVLSSYQRFLQRVLIRVRPNVLAAWLKPLLRVKRVTVPTAHGTFWIDPVSLLGIALTNQGEHEHGMVQTLEKFLKPCDTFVDLGANEGYFTVIGARLCGAEGRVLAIEPQHRLLPVIEQNLKLNGLSHVEVLNAAISDQRGTATLHLTASTNSGGSGFHRHSKYKLPTQEIGTLTLEEALDAQKLEQVDLMKVDIEGFEYEALLGSTKVFEQHRVKALALELHPTILADRGKAAADIEQMLERCGYRCSMEFGNAVWLVD